MSVLQIFKIVGVAIIGLLVGGGSLIGVQFKTLRRRRRLEDLARIKVASAPAGLVKLQGYAWPAGATVRSSQGQPCVYVEVARKFSLSAKPERESIEVCGEVTSWKNHELWIFDAHESHALDRVGQFSYAGLMGGSFLVTLGSDRIVHRFDRADLPCARLHPWLTEQLLVSSKN